jgi:hypothetical protein
MKMKTAYAYAVSKLLAKFNSVHFHILTGRHTERERKVKGGAERAGKVKG